MIRVSRICILWIGFFYLSPIQLNGQSTESLQLIDVIDSLEHRFSVSFSFADNDLVTKKVILPSDTLTLKECLNYLAIKTNLEFRFISERYIAIKKKSIVLCGYIKDSESNTSLVNATILFDDNIILSDSSGFFEINPDLTSAQEVVISYVGYQPARISINELVGNECVTLLMKSQTSILKEVTVTNYPVPGISKLAEGSLEINAGELNLIPGLIQPDVLLAIQSLPGVQSIDESVSEINIRGGSTDQTLLLWNGIRMYQYGHFFGLISAPNPYLTRKVTLTKNGTTAVIGDGVSGTVDIQSLSGSEEFGVEAGLSMLNADFIIKKPIGSNTQIILSARRSINDLIVTPTYKQYFNRAFRNTEVIQNSSIDSLIENNQSLRFYDWSINFSSRLNKRNHLKFNLLNTSNKLEYAENEVLNGRMTSRTSSLGNNILLFGIKYDFLINPKTKLTSNSSLSTYKLDAINADVLNNQQLRQENEVIDFTADFKALHSISPRFEVVNGYQFNEKGISSLEDINNPQFRRFKKEILRTHSIFSEATYVTPSYSTNIRLGFRGNQYQDLKRFTFEPRLSINHKFQNDLSIELLAEKKSQSSTQIVDLQNDFLGVVKRQWRLSNEENIPLMISNQISTGLYYSFREALLSLEVYYKVVNGITSQSQEFQNQFEFINTSGSYRTKGIEFLAKKQFKSLSTWLSYNLSHNSYRFRNLISNDFPSNYQISHFASVGLSYTKSKLEVSAGATWFSGRPFTQPQSISTSNTEIAYEAPNNSNLPNYFRFDFSSKYNFKLGKETKVQIGCSIWNLSNQTNILNSFYRLDENNSIERFNQQGLRMTPNVSIRAWF